MAGVGVVAWTGWVLGTALGAVAGSLIGDPSRWGVEFAMPAMFTALFIALAEDRRHVITGVFAGVIALALPLLAGLGIDIPDSWFIVIASVGAASLAAVMFRENEAVMTDTFIWTVIAGMALLNFAIRFPPIAIVSRVSVPAPILRWLSFIPISVMGALVALEVLRPDGTLIPPATSPYVFAAIATALIYRITRSFLGATLAGMALFVLFRSLLGG